MNIDEIKEILKNKLSEKRFHHSLCTMEMCEKMAIHYNENVEDAKFIGLAHDIAKEMPPDKKIRYANENNISIDDIELECPSLLHAKIGADICKKQFNFSDRMCNAISLHTTGGENMDMLSKILFICDGIGIDRQWQDTEYVRDLAFKNLDESILYMLNLTITDCIKEKKPIHPNTILARNWLLLH